MGGGGVAPPTPSTISPPLQGQTKSVDIELWTCDPWQLIEEARPGLVRRGEWRVLEKGLVRGGMEDTWKLGLGRRGGG